MFPTTPTFSFKYDAPKKLAKKISSGSIKNAWRLVKSVKKLSSTATLVTDELESLSIADSNLSRSSLNLGLKAFLDYDISILIFAYLSSKDLCRCGQVSRGWRSLSHEATLWQTFCIQESIPIQPELDGLLELYDHHKGLWWKTFYVDYQSQKSKWARLAFLKWEVLFLETISSFCICDESLIYSTANGCLTSVSLERNPFFRDLRSEASISLKSRIASEIVCMIIEPETRQLVTGDRNGDICLWNLFTHVLICRLPQAHSNGVTALAFTDPCTFLSTGFDGYLNVYKLQNEKSHESHHRKGPELLKRISSKLRRGESQNPIYRTTIQSVKKLQAHQSDIYAMTYVKEHSLVVTAAMDSTLKLWDSNFETMGALQGHSDSVLCLCTHHGFVYSGSMDKTIRKWNLETQACDTVLHGHDHWIKALAVNDDWLISGGWDESIFIWDLNLLCLSKKVELQMGPVSAIHLDNRKIVVHCRGKNSGNTLTVLNFGLEALLVS